MEYMMNDYWGDEQFRRACMEEKLQGAARHRLLAAAGSRSGTGINPESLKRLAYGSRLDKTIVLGGIRVRITAG
jgi:hypothetical protein